MLTLISFRLILGFGFSWICRWGAGGGGGGGGGGGLGFDMGETPKEAALRTFWAANPAVQKVIFDQGLTHMQARLQAALALEQRVSQVAALLFAAAAVAAQTAWAVKGPPAVTAGRATICFVVGALVAFHGVKAGELAIPGADPAWWSRAENISSFTDKDAEYWAVGHMQDAIDSLDKMVIRRSGALNLSLRYGVAAGIFIAISGVIAMFR